MAGDPYLHGLAAEYRCPTDDEIDRCLAALGLHLRDCPAGSPHRRKITRDVDMLLDRRLARADRPEEPCPSPTSPPRASPPSPPAPSTPRGAG
jgi:hypothetical protein